jgi:hypothetical protein
MSFPTWAWGRCPRRLSQQRVARGEKPLFQSHMGTDPRYRSPRTCGSPRSSRPSAYLPEHPVADALLADGTDPAEVAARFPGHSAAWATLAENAFEQGEVVQAYAYARTGYHRGLDQLRRAGWGGHGPIPWEHEPNRGFLRSLSMLGRAAAAIGEGDEAIRCRDFLRDSSAEAAAQLSD